MAAILRIGMIVVACSMLLPLCACSRTSDGTIVMEKPAVLPSLNLPAKSLVPSWMRRKKPEPQPVSVARNFPPPPAGKAAPRRKARSPVVVTSGSGNLACRNVSEGGRVRMICE